MAVAFIRSYMAGACVTFPNDQDSWVPQMLVMGAMGSRDVGVPKASTFLLHHLLTWGCAWGEVRTVKSTWSIGVAWL